VRAFVAATARASHAAQTNEAQAVAGMKNGLATAASERSAHTTAQQQDQLPALPRASLIFDVRYVPKGL
jgi:hypothetical protein